VYATNDVLVCTLENSLTPSERAILELGEHSAGGMSGRFSSTSPRSSSSTRSSG
jgi:hypothetical protein